MRITMSFVYSILAIYEGEGYDPTKHVQPLRIIAPVLSQEPLAYVSLVKYKYTKAVSI